MRIIQRDNKLYYQSYIGTEINVGSRAEAAWLQEIEERVKKEKEAGRDYHYFLVSYHPNDPGIKRD